MALTIITFIFVLGLLIFIHEGGHFLAAKKAGIKVEEFAFGFPPRIIRKKLARLVIQLMPCPWADLLNSMVRKELIYLIQNHFMPSHSQLGLM